MLELMVGQSSAPPHDSTDVDHMHSHMLIQSEIRSPAWLVLGFTIKL